MNKRRLARLISHVFDPLLILPFASLFIFLWAYVNNYDWQKMLWVLVIDTVPVLIVMIGVVQNLGFKDWDIHRREWRLPVLLTAVAVQAIGVWLTIQWGYEIWSQLLSCVWLITGVYFLLTLKWRVSIHVGVMATLATLLVFLGGWHYWWMFGMVVLVAWARVVGHDHSVAQTVAGALVPPVTLITTVLFIS